MSRLELQGDQRYAVYRLHNERLMVLAAYKLEQDPQDKCTYHAKVMSYTPLGGTSELNVGPDQASVLSAMLDYVEEAANSKNPGMIIMSEAELQESIDKWKHFDLDQAVISETFEINSAGEALIRVKTMQFRQEREFDAIWRKLVAIHEQAQSNWRY